MTTYPIHQISSKEELLHCPTFNINHFLWTCRCFPETFGRMGYLKHQGLYLEMTCLESNPKRELQNHRDMVCQDSAVEAFFSFPDKSLKQTDSPEEGSLYLNFEINANGAMYAKYGYGRKNRSFITEVEYAMTGVKTVIKPDMWTAELLIPMKLLERVSGISEFFEGDILFCNFYKISEDPIIEHYAAYSPIPVEKPNFHLPQYFARAEIMR